MPEPLSSSERSSIATGEDGPGYVAPPIRTMSVTMTAEAGRNALDALNRAHVLMEAADERGEGGRRGYGDSMAWVRWLEARIRRGCSL